MKNKFWKLINIIASTTLVSSPIIAMGGGLINSESKDNKATATQSAWKSDDIKIVMCDEWTESVDGSNTYYTCEEPIPGDPNSTIVIRINNDSHALHKEKNGYLTWDLNSTKIGYTLDLSSITTITNADVFCSANLKSLIGVVWPETLTEINGLASPNIKQMTFPKSFESFMNNETYSKGKLSPGLEVIYFENDGSVDIRMDSPRSVKIFDNDHKTLYGTTTKLCFISDEIKNKYQGFIDNNTYGWGNVGLAPSTGGTDDYQCEIMTQKQITCSNQPINNQNILYTLFNHDYYSDDDGTIIVELTDLNDLNWDFTDFSLNLELDPSDRNYSAYGDIFNKSNLLNFVNYKDSSGSITLTWKWKPYIFQPSELSTSARTNINTTLLLNNGYYIKDASGSYITRTNEKILINSWSNPQITNWTEENKNLGAHSYELEGDTGVKVASFTANKTDFPAVTDLDGAFSADLVNFKKDGADSTDADKFSLSVEYNGTGDSETRGYDIYLKWADGITIPSPNYSGYTFDIQLKFNKYAKTNDYAYWINLNTATGYNFSFYQDPISSAGLQILQQDKIIWELGNQPAVTDLKVATFTIDNYDLIDKSQCTNWFAYVNLGINRYSSRIQNNNDGTFDVYLTLLKSGLASIQYNIDIPVNLKIIKNSTSYDQVVAGLDKSNAITVRAVSPIFNWTQNQSSFDIDASSKSDIRFSNIGSLTIRNQDELNKSIWIYEPPRMNIENVVSNGSPKSAFSIELSGSSGNYQADLIVHTDQLSPLDKGTFTLDNEIAIDYNDLADGQKKYINTTLKDYNASDLTFNWTTQTQEPNFTNWSARNKQLGEFDWHKTQSEWIDIGSFSVDNINWMDENELNNLNNNLSCEFTTFEKDGGSSDEKTKFELAVEQDGSDTGTTRNYIIKIRWNNNTVALGNYSFGIRLKYKNTNTAITDTGFEFSIVYAEPSYNQIITENRNHSVTVGSQSSVTLGTFSIANWNDIDQGNLDFDARFKNWQSNNGTTGDNISLSVEPNDSTSDPEDFKIVASWNKTKFTRDDTLRFDVVVRNHNIDILETQEQKFQWSVVYEPLTDINIREENNNISKTISDWDTPTTNIGFEASPIPSQNTDPNAFNDADWNVISTSGEESDKFSIKENTSDRSKATLEIKNSLSLGEYNLEIECRVGNILKIFNYEVIKTYRNWSASDYDVTGGLYPAGSAYYTGEASEPIKISPKQISGVNPDYGDVEFNILNVTCNGDPSFNGHNIYVNDNNKIAWDAVQTDRERLTFNFTIEATFTNHSNAKLSKQGTLTISSKYANEITIATYDDNNTTTLNATAGEAGSFDSIVKITDVKDDTGGSNWNANYEGRYAISWSDGYDQGVPVSDFFQLEENPNSGDEELYNLVYNTNLKPETTYSIDIKYEFNNSPNDHNFSGSSNKVTVIIKSQYDIPEINNINISGPNTLNGVQAVASESQEYIATINNPNMDNPNANISFELLDIDGSSVSEKGIYISTDSGSRKTKVLWDNSIKAGTYHLRLYAIYQYESNQIRSQAYNIQLDIACADPSSIKINGSSKLNTNDEIKSSQFNIAITSSNGNINSLDPKYIGNDKYEWSISSSDEETKTAISSGWISINDGLLTWTEDLKLGHDYSLTINAWYSGTNLNASFNVIVISGNPIIVPMAIGISIGAIILLMIIVTLFYYLSRSGYCSPRNREKFLTTFNRKRQ